MADPQKLVDAYEAAQLDREAWAAVRAVLNLHRRIEPGQFSLVDHSFCSCGVRETVPHPDDGYPMSRPTSWPCATVRAILDEFGGADV